MDTEFPGVILRPIGSFKTTSDYHYQTLKSNIDLLKPIQLGLTFSDPDLNHRFVFQFNFREFDPSSDVYATDSIDLLQDSGINFERNLEYGVDVVKFGELLMTSGVMLNDSVQWITFHSDSSNLLAYGPYGLIFASFVPFYVDIPVSSKLRVLGINFTKKSLIYLAGVQLLLSSLKRSLLPGICGILVGILYQANVFHVRSVKVHSVWAAAEAYSAFSIVLITSHSHSKWNV